MGNVMLYDDKWTMQNLNKKLKIWAAFICCKMTSGMGEVPSCFLPTAKAEQPSIISVSIQHIKIIIIMKKITGGASEVCSNKSLTLLTFDIYLTFNIPLF